MKKYKIKKEDSLVQEKDLFPLFKSEPPFMKFTNGFGYYGVLLQDKNSGKIQCHFCGKLFKNLYKHAWHKHDRMSAFDYRESVGLNKYTPLVCESTSKKIRFNFTSLPKKEKERRIELLRDNNKNVFDLKKYKKRKIKCRTQYLNRNGTCELQAKSLFWKETKELGKFPLSREMSQKLKYLVYDRFGSYEKAMKCWGVNEEDLEQYRYEVKMSFVIAREEKDYFPKYHRKQVLKILKEFYSKENRLPTWSESYRIGLPSRGVYKRIFGTYKKDDLEKIVNVT